MPEFQPIEQLVGNWKQIPPSAFPRKVTLKAKAKYIFAGGAGSSTAPAGAKTFAISLSGENLVITPNTQSKVRGTISIDDTDYKEILGEEYESINKGKERGLCQKSEIEKSQSQKLNSLKKHLPTTPQKSNSNQVTSISRIPKDQLSDYENEIGEMPEADNDGRVPIMVSSIRSGAVSEIRLNEISYWGPIRYEIVDNRAYWTATVNYKTTSLFGTFPTEAMALMRNGKVENWLYRIP